MPSTEPFDANASAFSDYQRSPWGRLLHDIAAANVQRHLDGQPLRVLDAGGGSGVDAILFAGAGHAVTIIEPSVELVGQARANAGAAGVNARMEFHQAKIADIPRLFPVAQFDLVLCHNVLQYVDDMAGALGAICQALLPGGLLSVVSV
ncbi:MAG TPA: methyltransferase domain-containing protein, partial [Chloroflexia bacterium]|nr:methyltransferase domain-containing protein [Chloroflexia bacterium]